MAKSGMNLNTLNEYLFTQMERLSDDKMSDEQLERELRRTDAYINVATAVIQNGQLQLNALKLVGEYGENIANVGSSNLLGIGNEHKKI